MEQVHPTDKSLQVPGAVVLDHDGIARLTALAKTYLGPEAAPTFELVRKDRSKVVTKSVDDLAKLPLHHANERDDFDVIFEGEKGCWGPRLSISYSYRGYSTYVRVRDVPRLLELAAEAEAFLIGSRPWYWPLFSPAMRWLPVLLSLAGCAIIVGVDSPHPVLRVIGLVMLFGWIPVELATRFMFQKTVVLFGEEARREERRATLRRNSAKALFAAVVVTAAAGFFQAFFAS